jgi:hydrogenase nickel incorporation protein HypA/HybF
MHELYIAQSILKLVEDTLTNSQAKTVNELELEIGVLAGIEYDAIEFALKVISNNSILSNATIIINKPGGKASCLDCKKDFLLNSLITICPYCKGTRFEITGGKELRVKSMLVD